MTRDEWAPLSALIDGEPVDPDALAAALDLPGAGAALVEFVRLRSELARDVERPSARLYRAIEEATGGPVRQTKRWRVLQTAAAAVVLALAALGALSVPDRLRRGDAEPPRADRVVHFTPGVDWHEGGVR